MPSAVGCTNLHLLLKWVNCKNVSHQLKRFCYINPPSTFQLDDYTLTSASYSICSPDSQQPTLHRKLTLNGELTPAVDPLASLHVSFHLKMLGEEHYAAFALSSDVLQCTGECKILSLSLVWMNCQIPAKTLVGRARLSNFLVTKL